MTNITLELNGKDKYQGWCPLFFAIRKNNIIIIKLIINYATKNSIILELDERNEYGTNIIIFNYDIH